MKQELIRRQQLGLTIHGPYSRNRRRPSINSYAVMTAGIILAAALFLVATFTL
jgi:hypothetical protein